MNIGKLRLSVFHLLSGIAVVLAIIILSLIGKGRQQPGEVLYRQYCGDCHLSDGSGLAAVIPPLNNADWVAENQDRMACIIKYGLKGSIIVNGTEYDGIMPPLEHLSDAQIMNIINYMNTAWDNNLKKMTVKDIQDQLSSCTTE